MDKRSKRRRIIPLVIAIVVIVVVVDELGPSISDWLPFGGDLDFEAASKKLTAIVDDIPVTRAAVRRRANVPLGSSTSIADTLPDIARFPVVVTPRAHPGAVVLEIFASTEKSGKGTDGWLAEVANAFNDSRPTLQSGRPVAIRLRKIASGTGYQFIASGKHVPHAFTPSNALWVHMVEAHGVETTLVRERLVGNVAGIVMKTEVADRLRSSYGSIDVKNVIDAVVQGDLVMGYTNPFASSTGLNFLVTILSTFSGGDNTKLLEPDVVSAFESFQRGVPFVALTTLQMRDSVEKDGSLDAFVMEYQTFAKTAALTSGYEFIPFGIRHDNPLYAIGARDADEREGLELFAAFAEQERFTRQADEYGFNPDLNYAPRTAAPAGDALVSAQRLWKEKKDAGRPVVAVFLCDISGSMGGKRIRGLKEALAKGAEFISADNSIGLVGFNDRVHVMLPIKRFDLNQKAAFLGSVQALDVGGGTAMYDGVAVSLSMLLEAARSIPDAKLLLFVLTDGVTNEGLKLADVERVIRGVRVPVYTIGYEADIEELGRLSSLVEAANLNSREGEIEYKIGTLLNAQM